MPRFPVPVCILLLTAAFASTAGAQDAPPPILDLHIHTLAPRSAVSACVPIDPYPAWDPAVPWREVYGTLLRDSSCAEPMVSPASPETMLEETLGVMRKLNVYGLAVGAPDRVAGWVEAAPDRFMSGILLWINRDGQVSPDSIRALHATGRLDVLGEVASQYSGVAPGDEAMDPYWQLAEELDLPVGIHMGIGVPGVRYLGRSDMLARLSNPLLLEEVLTEYPGLRIYVMHAGYPMLEELLALMWAHPHVYAEVSAWIVFVPRPAAESYLRRMVEAGFSKRILFASDAQMFPQGIERAVRIIREAPFLTEEQKRDILYNNAARFLRLSDEEIARHHRGG